MIAFDVVVSLLIAGLLFTIIRRCEQADPEADLIAELRRQVVEVTTERDALKLRCSLGQTTQELELDKLRGDVDHAYRVAAAEMLVVQSIACGWAFDLSRRLQQYPPNHRPDCRRGLPSMLRPCTCGLFDAIGPLSDREVRKRKEHPELGPWDAESIRARGES